MRRRLAGTGILLAALVPVGTVLATAPPSSPPDTAPASTGPAETAAETTTTDTAVADTAAADPEATASTAAGETTIAAGETTPGAAATIFNEDREPVAEVTVSGTEPEWTDYGEDDGPDEEREYFRMTVTVQSLTTDDDTFSISVGDFILQDTEGFVDSAETVPSAAQAESDEEITDEADLASGESLELTLTFEVHVAADPQSVFYRVGDPDRLVDIGDVTA